MICLRLAKRLTVLPFAAAMALAVLGSADHAAAKKKESAEKRDPYAVTERQPGQAVLAVVSLKAQRVTVYDADGAILSAPVSSGQTGYETPVGIYSVLQKEAEHYSNLYDDASMPHMQRITWSGVALHGGPLPGYAASHGCVRLPYKFAERLFGFTNLGLRVIVSNDNVAPAPISHPLLFKRTPYRSDAGLVTKATALVGNMLTQPSTKTRDEPEDVTERAASLQAIVTAQTAEADAAEKQAEGPRALVKERTADKKSADKVIKSAERAVKQATDGVAYAEKILSRAKSEKSKQRAEERKAKADAKLAEAQAKLETVMAEAQPKIDAYQQAADALKAIEDVRDAALTQARAAERKLAPVSVFVSLKTQKLYVRQNFQPVFEVPITIADPQRPIGTHTYTAVDYGEDGRHMRWNVVSVAGPSRDYYDDYAYNDYENDYDDYDRPRRRRRAASGSKQPTPTDVAAASAVLDRITIPPEAVERISELVLPGSSLIVSDEEASKETGQQTDFVVLVSGFPQGAIKKRPKRDPYAEDYFGYNDADYDRRRRRPGPIFRWW
jgi:L,D-transpeptidase catalytic domain